MTYVLEKILTVRDLRENRALNRLVQSRAALIRAEELKSLKQRELGEYCRWRLDQERRLFGELRDKTAAVKDLNLFKDTVRSLRQDQAERARQVEVAAGREMEARTMPGRTERKQRSRSTKASAWKPFTCKPRSRLKMRWKKPVENSCQSNKVC